MSKPRTTDPAKGYRLHFNTLEHSEGLPTFPEGTVWYPKDSDLKDRETRTIKKLDDLLALMQDKDNQERLRESVVIFGTKEIPFRQFFVRESEKEKDGRFRTLYNRLARGRGIAVPCAMLFEASETKTIRDHGKGQQSIEGQSLTIAGKKVVFDLRFDYMVPLKKIPMTINEGQLILVTGMAERKFISPNFDVVCVHVDHEDAARWITKEELTTAPPPYVSEPMTGVPPGLLPLHGE